MKGNYWRGDWLTTGGVARIIGAYDASNAKKANLGVDSVKFPGRRWVWEGYAKRGLTRDRLCQQNRPWCGAGVG